MEGARACPPEDCGGVPGFEHVLAASTNPKRVVKDLVEWLGDYDPTAFDLAAVNRVLARQRV
jgi:hypothetical protein